MEGLVLYSCCNVLRASRAHVQVRRARSSWHNRCQNHPRRWRGGGRNFSGGSQNAALEDGRCLTRLKTLLQAAQGWWISPGEFKSSKFEERVKGCSRASKGRGWGGSIGERLDTHVCAYMCAYCKVTPDPLVEVSSPQNRRQIPESFR